MAVAVSLVERLLVVQETAAAQGAGHLGLVEQHNLVVMITSAAQLVVPVVLVVLVVLVVPVGVVVPVEGLVADVVRPCVQIPYQVRVGTPTASQGAVGP